MSFWEEDEERVSLETFVRFVSELEEQEEEWVSLETLVRFVSELEEQEEERASRPQLPP